MFFLVEETCGESQISKETSEQYGRFERHFDPAGIKDKTADLPTAVVSVKDPDAGFQQF